MTPKSSVGGTLFHLKELGWELGILTMTSGDCGSTNISRDEIARIRFAEAQAAAELVGATYACVGLIDAEVFANAENLRQSLTACDDSIPMWSSLIHQWITCWTTKKLPAWFVEHASPMPYRTTRQGRIRQPRPVVSPPFFITRMHWRGRPPWESVSIPNSTWISQGSSQINVRCSPATGRNGNGSVPSTALMSTWIR